MIVLTLGRIIHLTFSCSVLLSPVSSEENIHTVCEICWESGVKKGKEKAGELGIPTSRIGNKINFSK